jgi:thymidine kinase
MNSGKTTSLLQVAHNYKERGMEVLIIKTSIDKKGGNRIVSRLGVEKQVDIMLSKTDEVLLAINHVVNNGDPKEFMDKCNKFCTAKCILVDEAQFLTKQQVNDLYYVTKVLDIPVICYGLRTDFKTNGFEGSIRLLEIADDIEEMKTICRCGNKATQMLVK